MNLSDLKLSDIVKIAVTVTLTATITAAITLNIQLVTTNNYYYNQLANDVQDVRQEVQVVKNDTQILKENVTKSQVIQNKILKEVK